MLNKLIFAKFLMIFKMSGIKQIKFNINKQVLKFSLKKANKIQNLALTI